MSLESLVTRFKADHSHVPYCPPECEREAVVHLREVYERYRPRTIFGRWRERKAIGQHDDLMSRLLRIALRYACPFTESERKAFEQLLQDKTRLDYLEALLSMTHVTVSGNTVTTESGPKPQAVVHIEAAGFLGHGTSIRDAIDHARNQH